MDVTQIASIGCGLSDTAQLLTYIGSTHCNHTSYIAIIHLHTQVRRAAAKVITALLHTYPAAVSELYRGTAAPLAGRFREREDSVLQVWGVEQM